MSGITPLIDTLLHQVLGKRVDVPAPKPLNQPIKPTAPSEALKAVHSDSRLDARAPAPKAGEAAKGASRGAPAQAPASPSPGAPLSALTHFSATARTIADLLVRFPAPTSAVSPTAPLMSPDATAAPEQLAQRLAGSIRDSGLFYEAHLARWYKGELSRQQLDREPQMLKTLRFVPLLQASTSLSGEGRATEATSLLAARVRAAMPPVPMLPQAGASSRSGVEPSGPLAPNAGALRLTAIPATPVTPPPATTPSPMQATTMSVSSTEVGSPSSASASQSPSAATLPIDGRRDAVPESLQHLVRHQLEMLATPNLRWEGDVWSGLFMALVIQLPQGRREGQPGDDGASGERRNESQGWRSELDLEVAGLGPMKVSLWMRDARLDIDLRVNEEAARSRLEAGLEVLRRRLAGHGFDDVRLRLDAASGEVP
ncbi:flagellar hook-length control protein FliK [Halomonas sp. THAF12]|uniref:flagellar hook-length control protein FliK n=1 Tax=Halomonas sp. B23F22_10 TaxID=3459515 RepID=UPI00373F3DFF